MIIDYFLTTCSSGRLCPPIGFEGTDNIRVQGLITERDDETASYRSYAQNGTGPKLEQDWASVAAAIPRTFTGYIVNADSVDQAIRSTKAFRDGAHWAIHANSIGDIRMVRRGRIVA